MKLCAALVICSIAHGSTAGAACEDDVTALEDFMRHTDHVADAVDVPEGTHLVARDDLAPSSHALTITITRAGFSGDLAGKLASVADLAKYLEAAGKEHADPDWQKTKPGLAGRYGDILLVVDAAATWGDAVSAAQLAAKSGFTHIDFVFARAKQPAPPAHSSVDDLVASAKTSTDRSRALIAVRERLEKQCPRLGNAMTHAHVQHDTYEEAVIPAVRSWLTGCHCSAPMPEVRSYLFYMFAPELETGFITVELDKHARAIALPAHTSWRDAAAKLTAGNVWLVAN